MEIYNESILWDEYFDALEKRNYEKALLLIDKILEVRESPDVYVRKARILRTLGENDKALEYFDKALKLKPKYILANFLKGALLVSLGKLEEAKEVFLKLCRLEKSDLPVKYVTAFILKNLESMIMH